MVHAANPILNQTPKTLNGIGVNVAFDVDATGMLDSAMTILQRNPVIVPQEFYTPIRTQFIGVDGAARSYVLLNQALQLVFVHGGHGL